MKPVNRLPALACLLFGFATAGLAAQSNDRIDELLLQPVARLDSTAYLVLASTGQIAESDSPATALEKAKSLGLVNADLGPDSPVQIQDLSFLVMKSLQLNGGVMFSLFPNSRYAYRELAYAKMIDTSRGPFRTVSGEEVIRVLGVVSEQKRSAP